MGQFVFDAADESDTQRLGEALADALPDGAVIALEGPLGAGKTRLVQAVAQASGVERQAVTSPTFMLVQEYYGRRPIFHFDAYRLNDDDEFLSLGPEEYFHQDGLSLVEWASRVERCLPRERMTIEIEPTGSKARRFTITTQGAPYDEALQRLRARLP